MNKHPYRALLIWVVLAVALFNIYPTVGWTMLSPESREARMANWKAEDNERAKTRQGPLQEFWHGIKRWAEFDRDRVINLGLDLQGGVHMVLSFDWNELPEERKKELIDAGYSPGDIQQLVQEQVLQQITRRVNDFEAKEPIIQTLGDDQVQIQLPGEKDIQRAKNLITKTAQLNFHIVAGNDESIRVFTALRDAYPDQFLPYINRPVPGEPFTVSVDNFQRVREVLTKAANENIIPADKMLLFSQPPKAYDPQQYTIYVVDREPLARGEGLTSASAVPDNERPPYWAIYFQMSSAAGAEFAEATGQNIGRPMAIVVDDTVISAPTIQARIGTNGQITGNFADMEARDLAIALNSGSMVVPVHEQMSRVVGASLGADAVEKGVVSSLGALLAVGIFMVIYYRLAGLIAVVSLVINALLIIALMAYFNMTLTLPGIAGLILTVGMAVDSNILIFERIREELKLGHTLTSSVENGFKRVAVTILDANITTLIAAAVLFQFGTGPIEGFAITLTIGILTTVFTALVVSHAMIDFLIARKILKKFTMMSILPRQPQVRWLSYGRMASSISLAVILIGFAVFFYRGDKMFGVDFTEGTTMEVVLASSQPVEVNQVRLALGDAGFNSPIVQEVGEEDVAGTNRLLIRVGDINPENAAPAAASGALEEAAPAPEAAPAELAPAPDLEAAPAAVETPAIENPAAEVVPETAPAAPADAAPAAEEAPSAPAASAEAEGQAAPEAAPSALATATVGSRIREALAPLTDSRTAEGVEIIEEQTVGPAVGAQLRMDALQATFAAFFFIIIYMAIRFELKFAAGAMVAVLHDMLITLGVFALLGLEIDMNVIAAIHTLVGYSLNDTIVIFDRVREEMRLNRGKALKFNEILDLSMNVTMSRTILTSLLTFFVVVVLAIFGGDALRGFSIALCIGIVAGSYSTIFIASPVALWWHNYQIKRAIAEEVRLADSSGRRRKPPKAIPPTADQSERREKKQKDKTDQ